MQANQDETILPYFHIADRSVEPDDDDVISGTLHVRGVSRGERTALHLEPEESDFQPDFLDDFLLEHAAEFDPSVGVLGVIGMSTP